MQEKGHTGKKLQMEREEARYMMKRQLKNCPKPPTMSNDPSAKTVRILQSRSVHLNAHPIAKIKNWHDVTTIKILTNAKKTLAPLVTEIAYGLIIVHTHDDSNPFIIKSTYWSIPLSTYHASIFSHPFRLKIGGL